MRLTGFIDSLKENDVRQMSRCRNRILQMVADEIAQIESQHKRYDVFVY